jgi:hypothetical protein
MIGTALSFEDVDVGALSIPAASFPRTPTTPGRPALGTTRVVPGLVV